MIGALVEQARTGPTATRLEALERLGNLGVRHGLDTALELVGDADEAVARESAQMLADTLAMQDRAGIAALEQRGGEVAKQVRATLEALRRASTDPRANVRDAAAPTMAALGDRDTLWQITLATIKGEIPGTEGPDYLGLAPVRDARLHLEVVAEQAPEPATREQAAKWIASAEEAAAPVDDIARVAGQRRVLVVPASGTTEGTPEALAQALGAGWHVHASGGGRLIVEHAEGASAQGLETILATLGPGTRLYADTPEITQ